MTGDQRREHGIWEALRILADRYDGTRTDLASEAEMSPSTLCNLESGRRKPSEEVTARLAYALDVPVWMLARPAEDDEAAAS